MKEYAQDRLALALQQGSEILDQIRYDHELIERLRITPEELEALSKCALFGTLTCKEDMLFILRQIREAGDPAVGGPIDQTPLFPQPARPEDQEEDPMPVDCRRIAVRLAGTAVPEPGSLAGVVRRRVREQFGVLFWTIVLVVGLAWNLLIAMSRRHNNFMTSVGMATDQASHSATWYSNLDQSYILLSGEVLFVVSIAVVMFLKSRRGYRRFKVRPGRSWR
jgi:hypothetical protein